MTVATRLLNYLERHHVDFEEIEHDTDFTAARTAAHTHTPGRAFAKTVIVHADKKPVMLVMPAHHQVDLERLRGALAADEVRLASEEEAEELFPDSEIGAFSGSLPRPVHHAHVVLNHRDAPQSVSFESSSLLGWASDVLTDPDCDGDPADGAPVGDAIVLDAEASACILHAVTVPPGLPAGTTEETTLTATGSAAGSGTVTDLTSVGPRVLLRPDHLFAEGFMMINTCSATLSTPMTESEIDALIAAFESGFRKIA